MLRCCRPSAVVGCAVVGFYAARLSGLAKIIPNSRPEIGYFTKSISQRENKSVFTMLDYPISSCLTFSFEFDLSLGTQLFHPALNCSEVTLKYALSCFEFKPGLCLRISTNLLAPTCIPTLNASLACTSSIGKHIRTKFSEK